MCSQWKILMFYVLATMVLIGRCQPRRDGYLTELLKQHLSNIRAGSPSSSSSSSSSSSDQLNGIDSVFQRLRKQAPPTVRCGGGSGRNPYECNDGLMGVWLRLMKNPDYSD